MQDVGTKVEDLSGQQLVGQQIYEYGAQGHHKGDTVMDVFESTGERHYFQGDLENNLRGTKSVEPVSDFMARRGIKTPAMEVRDKGDALAAEIANNKGDALAQQTTEDQQETVQEDLQESAGEAGPESIQEALQEKAQEKAKEIAEDKAKETVKEINDVDGGGKPKETPKGKVRVRKASTARFYYSDCSVCSFCCQCY
jgi:hypothetical protein